MNNMNYEHHGAKTYLSELCPFKIKYLKNSCNSSSNWHINPEIMFVSNGCGTLMCDGESYPMNKGDMFIINQDTVHHVFSQSGIDYYFMIVDADFCNQNGILLEKYIFNIKVNDKYTKNKFLNVIKETERYTEVFEDISSARLRNAVLSLLIDMMEKHSVKKINDKTKSLGNYVRNAIEYISNNFTDNMNLEDISDSLGINKFYLSREFKRYTGQTVFTYINNLRIKKAENLLSQGMSVTEAAMECGFSSVSYFSRTYKKIMGISPTEYKKTNKTAKDTNQIKLYVESNWINS